MQPLVSVIIPLFNCENYIEQALSSVINQTYKNLEIIVVDDGSSDSSLKKVKSIIDNRLFLFNQENKGASAARNVGLRNAKGKYIQFLDADDVLHPEKIENQIEILNGDEHVLALGPTVYFDDESTTHLLPISHEWYKNGSKNTIDFLIKLYGGDLVGKDFGGAIQPNAWLTPKRIIDKVGLWNEKLSLDDDGEFFCRVVLSAKEIRYAKNSLNYYRKHSNGANLSSSKSHTAMRSALNSTILKEKHIRAAKDDPMVRLVLSRLYWENAIVFFPEHFRLYSEAKIKAKTLAPKFLFNPHGNGFKKKVSNIFGWRFVKILQVLAARFRKR